jgi:hypothetical protein
MAISDNWQRTAPSTTFGTPALDFYVVDVGADVEGEIDWEASDSLYSKAVRGIQLVATLYMVGRPSGRYFTFAVVSNTCPGRNPGATSGRNSNLQNAIDSATGESSYVYYAAFDGNNMVWDD